MRLGKSMLCAHSLVPRPTLSALHHHIQYGTSLVPRPSPSFPSLATSDGKLGGGLGTRLVWDEATVLLVHFQCTMFPGLHLCGIH